MKTSFTLPPIARRAGTCSRPACSASFSLKRWAALLLTSPITTMSTKSKDLHLLLAKTIVAQKTLGTRRRAVVRELNARCRALSLVSDALASLTIWTERRCHWMEQTRSSRKFFPS